MNKPNFIIVSGNGRNSGKTTFVERVIKQNCRNYAITAVKVSPHFHSRTIHKNSLITNENYSILEETDTLNTKDSSRMLRAGAEKVFYIECTDDHLGDAMQYLLNRKEINGPVVCESGGLRKLVKPSLFLLLTRPDLKQNSGSFMQLCPLADIIVYFEKDCYDLNPEKIIYTGNRWEIQGT